jgi:hypothetical protein
MFLLHQILGKTVHLVARQAFKTPDDLAAEIFLNTKTGNVSIRRYIYSISHQIILCDISTTEPADLGSNASRLCSGNTRLQYRPVDSPS